MNSYDCDFCIAHKLYENRACYLLDNDWGEDRHKFILPVFDPLASKPMPIAEEDVVLTKESIISKLDKYQEVFPDAPPFELLTLWFTRPKELCLTSILDPQLGLLLDTESACKEYRTLPYGGGLWDQPLALLEAFDLIRSERNQFERIRIEKLNTTTKKVKPDSQVVSKIPGRSQ